MISKMFEMQKMERILVENPEYVPPHRTFWMPSDDPLPALSINVERAAAVLLESPAPDRVPATIRPEFDPTPTGRTARGQLEYWVKEQCDIWLVEEYKFPCTLNWLAEQIAHDQAIDPPSVGAVDAVLKRWEKLGFAVLAKKPNRFVEYTPDGIKLGLEGLKLRAKRARRQQVANQRRGLR